MLLRGAGLGSSMVTGLFLAGSTAVLFAFSNWRRFLFNELDALFVLLAASAAISFALHGRSATAQDTELLLLSLATYPAGRLLQKGDFGRSFVWTTSIIVAVGMLATVYALVTQWGDYLSKPVVFGYGHAATVFLLSLGFALIAIAAQLPDIRRARIVCAIFALPTFVFSVSLVRFIFVALMASLYVAARKAPASHRRSILTLMMMVALATSAGILVRYDTWEILGKYIISDAVSAEEPVWTPEVRCGVTINNSIGVRTVLKGRGQGNPASRIFRAGTWPI
ncbi:hypothetical protein CQ10_37795 [Bradyrhizobium valentinum]|nr:hypothetical protein CQ10_37795 [Bradyrhizobium valentinum]